VAASPSPEAPANPPSRQLRSRTPARLQELGLVVVVIILWTLLTIFGRYEVSPGVFKNLFMNPDNLIDQIATPMSYYAIMAIGMTMVIISGGIDISVGSIMAVSALGAAWILPALPRDAPWWQAIPLALLTAPLIGLLCGLINGVLTTGLKLHPFIVTLGTLSIFRGIAIVAPPAATLPLSNQYLPASFYENFMLHRFFGGLRLMPLAIMLIVVAAGWFYLSRTVGGREIYAVGGNEEAARFSGLRVDRIKLRVYSIAGLTAGLAGLVSIGRFGAASTSTAVGYELNVIAATVVGGASLIGGRGTALGAFLGTLVIATIENAISIMHWKQEYQKIIVGAAIIIAVAIDRLSEYIRQRRLRGGSR
jgi:ribose/xylose/arabinose/galactoside ABC-type transport system permease subunit